jgi:hypothetical protein
MSPNKKVLLTVLIFFVAMLVIACSCSSIIPSISNVIPTKPPTGQETMPGLAGTWQDPETQDQFVIAWQNNTYVVTSVTWEGTSYTITSQSWNGSVLSWTYNDTDLKLTVTHTTTSLSGGNLNANWSYSDGTSGSETFTRVAPF